MKMVSLAMFAIALLASGSAAQGLVVTMVPSVITSGEPCTNVTISFCNLAPNTAYACSVTLTTTAGVPVAGYQQSGTLTTNSEGKITVTFCVALADGTYIAKGSAQATGGPALTGSAALFVGG